MALTNGEHGFYGNKSIYSLSELEARISNLENNNSSTAEVLNAIYPVGAIYFSMKSDGSPASWGSKLGVKWTWTPLLGTNSPHSKYLLISDPTNANRPRSGYAGGTAPAVDVNDSQTHGDSYQMKPTFSLSNVKSHTHSTGSIATNLFKKMFPGKLRWKVGQESTIGATSGVVYGSVNMNKTGTNAYLVLHPKTFQPGDNVRDGRLYLCGGLGNPPDAVWDEWAIDSKDAYLVKGSSAIPTGDTSATGVNPLNVSFRHTPPFYTVYAWRRTA